ncbi:MAG TPA: hypothetical protein VF519_16310 [Mycobacteriales bacterium]|jgi:MFS superfamily sulfate permease-like transporter
MLPVVVVLVLPVAILALLMGTAIVVAVCRARPDGVDTVLQEGRHITGSLGRHLPRFQEPRHDDAPARPAAGGEEGAGDATTRPSA